jgi:hypothetical protein
VDSVSDLISPRIESVLTSLLRLRQVLRSEMSESAVEGQDGHSISESVSKVSASSVDDGSSLWMAGTIPL